MNRITRWRHKTGRSRERRPHGEVDYFAVALSIARKNFVHFFQRPEIKEDLIQECELLSAEVASRKRVTVGSGKKRRHFGNGRDRLGIKSFSRAVYARLYDVSKKYGFFRPQDSKAFCPRKAWSWGLRDDWENSVPAFESPDLVLFQVKKRVPAEVFEKALDGNNESIAQIRAIIWEE